MPNAPDQSKKKQSRPRVGLSLSGGGTRAAAFHLGCLRALDALGVMDDVKIISSVSGGSITGALYAAKKQPFPEFEEEVRKFLRTGIVKPAVKTMLTTLEWPKALFCFIVIGGLSVLLLAVRLGCLVLSKKQPIAPLLRFASNTTTMARALDKYVFHGRRLNGCDSGKMFIINAADLRTGTPFCFTANGAGSRRYGVTVRKDIKLADAVMASMSVLAFPAMDRVMQFDKNAVQDGEPYKLRYFSRVVLTDGGVYDNLAVTPFMPDHDTGIDVEIPDLDTVVCCRAGYGMMSDPPTHFVYSRTAHSSFTAQSHIQTFTLEHANDMVERGRWKNFIAPFLGQDDRILHEAPEEAVPKDEIVTRDSIDNYPTTLAPMDEWWIDNLSKRGEQMTRALIYKQAPHLIKHKSGTQPEKAADLPPRGDARAPDAEKKAV